MWTWVASGVLSVGAALLASTGACLLFGLVALLALLAYALAVGRAGWAVPTGVGVLAFVAALRLSWHDGPADGTYAVLTNTTALLERWDAALDRERYAAVGFLLAVVSFAVGVLARGARDRSRWVAVVTTGVGLLLVVRFGVRLATSFGHYPMLSLLGAIWPAVLAVLVTGAALVLSGRRHDRWLLLPAGLLLLTVTATGEAMDRAASWAGWWATSAPRDGFLSPGMMVALPGADGFPQVSRAAETAVALAGPVLVALGALRRGRETPPDDNL
jgi:hypothetical protein